MKKKSYKNFHSKIAPNNSDVNKTHKSLSPKYMKVNLMVIYIKHTLSLKMEKKKSYEY